MKTSERRLLAMDELRVESREDGSRRIIGHGAVFNKLSENLGGFREKIAPGAFDDVLEDDVRALINHDSNHILGRTTSGTLKLSVDETGLRYEIDPPDRSDARDLIVSMERGDVTQSSFAFRVDEDEWEEDDETGAVIRTITKFARLYDVSPVTYPAYPDADVGLRSLEEWRASQEDEEDEQHQGPRIDMLRRQLDIAEAS